ncbi:hypothetical protein [Pseudolysinimonas sp.]|uniref:hypothetical protein n=1 Tax=Pseudolysinimonas sp. TaxID=2680009 RepID=UPI003F7EDA77
MKILAFVVAFVLFLGGMLLFGFAFSAVEAAAPWVFFGGIAAICVSLAIPFHFLGKAD